MFSSKDPPNTGDETCSGATRVSTTYGHGIISSCSSLQISSSDVSTLQQSFQNDGFAIFHDAIDASFVSNLQTRLEHVLRGRFDRGTPPDKMPDILNDNYDENNRNNAPLGFRPHNSKKKVIQIINIHKCDESFREIATCVEIGRMVGQLTGWKSGVRLAQDQVWAKPPGAPPLVFHRDSPYFMFTVRTSCKYIDIDAFKMYLKTTLIDIT